MNTQTHSVALVMLIIWSRFARIRLVCRIHDPTDGFQLHSRCIPAADGQTNWLLQPVDLPVLDYACHVCQLSVN